MAVGDLEGVLIKMLPVLTPPWFLMRDGKFPNTLKVFEDISLNPPDPRCEIGRKYLYLTRVTGMVWLLWAWNFSLFLSLAISTIFAWGLDSDLTQLVVGVPAKLLMAAGFAVLFIGAIMSFALLRVSVDLRDVCYTMYKQERGQCSGWPAI